MSQGGSAPAPESFCALEADCICSDILNRRDAVRISIAEAADQDRLVESLAALWHEERQRLGTDPPQGPPSPRRRPQDVCSMVTAARIDFARGLSEVRRLCRAITAVLVICPLDTQLFIPNE
jgi:hypothetical protein